jgi:signal transduction histidine kinase
MQQGSFHHLIRYANAIALVVAAVGFNLLLTRRIEPSAAPLLFVAVLLASWIGGWGPGLFATALAIIADDYLFISPIDSWKVGTAVVIRLAVLLTVSLLTSYLTSQQEMLLAAERRARLDAEEGSRLKDRFLAVSSHELRTPLTAAILWLDDLQRSPLNDEQEEAVRIIRNNANFMQRMVSEMLDISRITNGKLRIDLQPLGLADSVTHVLDTLRPQASAKGIELHLKVDQEKMRVNADPVRIEQAITNLLVNAVKFTPQGGRVDIGLTEIGGAALLTIRDSGHGIAKADLPNVFKEFWQAPDGLTRRGDGLGLGLSITRELIKLHGGKLAVQSDGLGQGTVFLIELPLIGAEYNSTAAKKRANIEVCGVNFHK